jgi:3-oxoacyl-[acyl-carrier-protein] synthase-3
MMKLQFRGKRMSGILTVVPDRERHFEDEAGNYDFTEAQRAQLKSLMGYNIHRVVSNPEVCVSDLCLWGLEYLFREGLLKPDEIDGLILVTQTPDYPLPATSSIIHGKAGLKRDCFCLDINQGCTGFNVGLIQAFMLLDQEAISKVVVLNADILSRKVSDKDKNSYPLIGDAASITVVESSPSESEEIIYANIQNDGTRCDAMMIPAGGLRLPNSVETASLEEDEKGGMRAKDHLVTKGDILFNFVQTEVPPMILELLETANLTVDDIDYFMFHQPNKFALNKLASRLGISQDRLFNNLVENLGNPSSASIPAVMTYNASEALMSGTHRLCLAGFGVGLSLSSMLINAGPMDFCKLVEMPC